MKKQSIKNQLLNEMRKHQYMRTSDVIKWGTKHGSNTAERKARLLSEEGKIHRMSKDAKEYLFGKTRESIWEINIGK